VAAGALWWIAYGYVGGEAFPLARPVAWEGRGVRYLRAAFLGAVSAATGETLLYLAPGADSLAQAWARRYAPLVRPLDSLPPSLRGQLPYPRLAFRTAAAQVTRSRSDTVSWTPRPREPFDLVAPSPVAGGRARRGCGWRSDSKRGRGARWPACSRARSRPRARDWRCGGRAKRHVFPARCSDRRRPRRACRGCGSRAARSCRRRRCSRRPRPMARRRACRSATSPGATVTGRARRPHRRCMACPRRG